MQGQIAGKRQRQMQPDATSNYQAGAPRRDSKNKRYFLVSAALHADGLC